ncbi:MAG: Dabb family protein [Planctomycetota bacterium]|nr:Dabb family protein [Planctomycetota bacterium]
MVSPGHHTISITRAATLAAGLLVGGCASPQKQGGPEQINHVVLIRLEDPGSAGELQQDCLDLLKPIPEVVYFACGPHVDVGRTNIEDDYSIGLIVSFENREAYDAYLQAPGHVRLVEKWKPRSKGMTIYDIGNTKPARDAR